MEPVTATQVLEQQRAEEKEHAGIQPELREALEQAGWFETPGAYVLVDGQFGSTGKGLLAGLIGEVGLDRITHVTTNAGPNSGHTVYLGGLKLMAQQVPIASIVRAEHGRKDAYCYLNGGAIIDIDILCREATEGRITNLVIHPAATIIRDEDRKAEGDCTSGAARIASTGKGVGAALAGKIRRECNTAFFYARELPGCVSLIDWDWHANCVFVETAQGFSLGINSLFYPHVTSRECTVMQAIADARIPCKMVRKVAACYRTYPIRVGNTAIGRSGNGYFDQSEIEWADIGVEPELTSVTKRQRRLFTWSRKQFRESIAANRPDLIFLNFMQYLDPSRQPCFIRQALNDYKDVIGDFPETVLLGYGPRSGDVRIY